MNNLITIGNFDFGGEREEGVNARDLHLYLEVGRDFSTWIKDKVFKSQLVEGVDFIIFPQSGENSRAGRPSKEYALSLDASYADLGIGRIISARKLCRVIL